MAKKIVKPVKIVPSVEEAKELPIKIVPPPDAELPPDPNKPVTK